MSEWHQQQPISLCCNFHFIFNAKPNQGPTITHMIIFLSILFLAEEFFFLSITTYRCHLLVIFFVYLSISFCMSKGSAVFSFHMTQHFTRNSPFSAAEVVICCGTIIGDNHRSVAWLKCHICLGKQSPFDEPLLLRNLQQIEPRK